MGKNLSYLQIPLELDALISKYGIAGNDQQTVTVACDAIKRLHRHLSQAENELRKIEAFKAFVDEVNNARKTLDNTIQ
ncbi:MAG: hypothetical protein GY807_20940 [Gammaproteobacteria bacterium]|nr:hypothetical protein [Gammaproteobacteria bacterium]